MLFKVNNIIENCNSIKIQIEDVHNDSYQNEDSLTNINTYIFINEFEETGLLENKLNDNIIELSESDYKLDIIDKFDEFNLSSSDSETNDI